MSQPDRNDIAGAIREAERLLDAGLWSPDHGQVFMMLQDDSSEYCAAFAKMIARRREAGLPVYKPSE